MEKNFIDNVKELLPPKNDTPYKRILAIGDVHACYDKLISLWEKISVTTDDLVIFLGDYVEGGDQNLNVLRWLINQNENENIIILRGNMDDMFLDSFAANNPNIIYTGEFNAADELADAAKNEPTIVKKVHDFLKNMPNYYEMKIGGRDYIFCHAGINVENPQERNKIDLIWGRGNFYSDYDGNAVIIVGHKSPRKVMKHFLPQFSELNTLKPVRIPNKNILLLDTRAKDVFEKRAEGYLSCVDILSGEFWQS